jgi:antitoxin component YwqK of YwqJK toxin-antitoxin module
LFWALLVAVAVVTVTVWLVRPKPVEEMTVLVSGLERVEGRLMVRGQTNQPFSGWMTVEDPEGRLQSRSHVLNGVLDGVSEGWFTNGVMQVREHFVAGKADGLVTKWHANGSKLSEGTAREGRLEGVFRRWHDNGRLAEEVTLRAGLAHGISRAWFPSGNLKAEVELEDGKVVQKQSWKDGERPGVAVAATGELNR